MSFSFASLFGGLLFSGIGFVAFTYGRKMENVQMMLLGIALMAYSYFAPSALWVYLGGAGLTGLLFLAKD